MAAPKGIEDQKTPEGKAKVAANQEIIDYITRLTSTTTVLVSQFAELQKLNKIMNEQMDKLSGTLVKQQHVYKELATQFKSLGEAQIGTSYESMYLVFAKINSSYVQIQKMISEVFKPLNKQQLMEQIMIQDKLNEIKNLKAVLAQSEKKLRDRKTLLFEQQDLTKWELASDCSESMESLFNNRIIAFREMLPRETKECTRHRVMYGYFCNKIKEEIIRINEKNRQQIAVALLFVSKINGDASRDVCKLWNDLAEKYMRLTSIKQSQQLFAKQSIICKKE